VKRLDLANALYGQVLILLEEVYAPGVGDDDRKVFSQAAMTLMQAVSTLGQQLARMPASPDHPGVTAGLTFTVPRNLGARGPGSADLILERLGELAKVYADVVEGGESSPVDQAYRQIEKRVCHCEEA
jgi:hypothetical protein